jgi:hypothetical protein
MLAKCANPACSSTFHYFHEGKLFTIESRIDSRRIGPPSDGEYTGRPHHLQYFWLCSACCCAMTVQSDGDHGGTIVRKRGVSPNVPMLEDRTQMVVGRSPSLA